MPTDIEIARTVPLRPIAEIAERAGVPTEAVYPHGRHLAKLDLDYVRSLHGRSDGKLILVTAINPTPPGEGKDWRSASPGPPVLVRHDGSFSFAPRYGFADSARILTENLASSA